MLRKILVFLVFALAAAPALAAPLEAYGRLPNIEAAELSPDGAMIAMVVTDGEHRRLAISRIGERAPFAILDAGDQKLRSIQWAGTNHVLLTATTTSGIRDVIATRGEYAVTIDYNLTTRTQRSLFRRLGETLNITAGGPWVRIENGHAVVVLMGIQFDDSGSGVRSLFRLDPETQRTRVADVGGPDTYDWAVDATGHSVASLSLSDRRGAWSMAFRPPGGEWRGVTDSPEYGGPPSILGLGREGDTLVVRGAEGNDETIRELNLATGAWSDPIEDDDPVEVLFDPATYRLSGLRYLVGDTYRYRFFNPAHQRLWNSIAAAYPGDRVQLASLSDDRRRAVVIVDSPTEGPAYGLVDMATGRASWLGPVYNGIRGADISPVRYITYAAGDGLQISGYLTLPVGREARNLPLVVLPHGGPEARDSGGFDWWAQALASRGYAVLQPNFRGSAGYGYAFVSAGFGEWGRKMQTDLSDGVHHLAQQGIVDAARVCIVGASYGGYAALAGVTLQSGVYRCAASISGVSDPAGLMRYAAEASQGDMAQRYWSEFMGVEGRRDPTLALISPLAHAADATAPILLIHGRDDTVVPFRQTQAMAEALRRANRPVQVIELHAEDHWLSRGATRLQMLTEVVTFLEANNPAR